MHRLTINSFISIKTRSASRIYVHRYVRKALLFTYLKQQPRQNDARAVGSFPLRDHPRISAESEPAVQQGPGDQTGESWRAEISCVIEKKKL